MAGSAQGVLGWTLPAIRLGIVLGVRLDRRVGVAAHVVRPFVGRMRADWKDLVGRAQLAIPLLWRVTVVVIHGGRYFDRARHGVRGPIECGAKLRRIPSWPERPALLPRPNTRPQPHRLPDNDLPGHLQGSPYMNC